MVLCSKDKEIVWFLSAPIPGFRSSLPQRCTARWLYDAGLRTVEAIAQLPDEEELVHILSKPRAGADHGRCGTWRVALCHVYPEDVCLERNIPRPVKSTPKTEIGILSLVLRDAGTEQARVLRAARAILDAARSRACA